MGESRKELSAVLEQIRHGHEVFSALSRSGYGLAPSAVPASRAGRSPHSWDARCRQNNPWLPCTSRTAPPGWDVLPLAPYTKASVLAAALVVGAAGLFVLSGFLQAARTRRS